MDTSQGPYSLHTTFPNGDRFPQQSPPTAPPSTHEASPSSAMGSKTHSQGSQEPRAPNGIPHGLNARSCVTCRRRKVKCDKKVPCTNCNKAGTECVFPAPGRAPRRPRQGPKVVSEREAELLKRLRRLEGVVEELSGQAELEQSKQSPGSDRSPTNKADGDSTPDSAKPVRVIGMDEGSGSKRKWMNRAFNLGEGPPKPAFNMEGALGMLTLEDGKSQYVSNPFWAKFSEEVEQIRDIMEEENDDSDDTLPARPSTAVTDSNHQSFIMGYNSSDIDLRSLHPLPSQIPFYWQTFLENVNPLTKFIHTATMTKVIKEVQNNLDSLSKSTEALMFAIYFATITSMNNEEVQTSFGVEKDRLVKQYRFGTEQALARAGFLNTNEIVTVQAFVLFLVCVRRHDDTRFVWSLTGLAIRICQSLGLHRDGAKFGLSPFDTEMRRRLWWQVCILDTRASEDHGTEPSILEATFDTERPLNINDADLDPHATESPTPRQGISEMTFCLIRYEICILSRRLSHAPPGTCPIGDTRKAWTIEEKEAMVKATSDRLESKYLQHCEDAGPLYWVAATVARLITAKLSLIIYHPLTQPGKPNSLTQDIRDRLFMASIEIMEYSRVLESEASTKKWGWLFHTYVQWHAIAYILGELAIRPPSVVVDRAWRAMDSTFADWDETISKTKSSMLWQPMRRLMALARRKREQNMASYQSNQSTQNLGIKSEYFRAAPSGLGADSPAAVAGIVADVARDRQASLASNTIHNHAQGLDCPDPCPLLEPVYNSIEMMPPQIVGMGPNYAPEQIQLHLQQTQQPQQTPWLMDDSAFLDLDMQGLEGSAEVTWDGWDALAKDLQMEDMQSSEMRGPTLGPSMSAWW